MWPPHAPAAVGPGEKNSAFAGGFNACQFGRLSPYFETYFVAVNSAQFSMGICGRCVAVRGTGPRATGLVVTMKVCDECATCDYGDLDFTTMVGGGPARASAPPQAALAHPRARTWRRATVFSAWAWARCALLGPLRAPPGCSRAASTALRPTPQGANAVTGYAFDRQPIEWWW